MHGRLSPPATHRTPFRRTWVRLALLPLCVLAAQAQAQVTYENRWDTCKRATGNSTLYQYYPPTTIQLANNAQIGDVIGPWISTGSFPAWECTRNPEGAGIPVQMSVPSKLVYATPEYDQLITHEGQSYRRSRLGEPYWGDIGYIARWRATIDGVATDWRPMMLPPGDYQAGPAVTVTKAVGEVYYIQTETQIRLIKRTNALVPGYQHIVADPTYAWHHQQVGTQWGVGTNTYLITQMFAQSVTFVGGGTCSTEVEPDPVTLPTVGINEFSGQGPLLISTTPFNLKFKSCPAGYSSIGYYFTPTTTILSTAQGVIALDSSATATGVGLQLTEDNGTVLKFGQANTYPLTAYDPSSVNTYTVPLKVSYYQTGSAPVTVGSVSSSVTVTLKYQ